VTSRRLAPWLAILTGRRTNRWRAVRRRSRGQRPRLARPVSPNLGNAAWTALGVLIAATVTSCIGSGERSAALPLQSLSAHVQRPDENAVGEFAYEGQMGRADRGHDRRRQHAKAARRCGVHYTTAFRWRHRFLASLAGDKPKTLTGIVEGDETFILESFKGKRSDMPRKSRKRGGKSAKRGLSAEQIPVIVARDRQGATTDAVLPKLNRVSIAAALDGAVTLANEFCCDGGTAIVAFARRAGIPAHVLPMPGKPNPKEPDFHINNVNAYHSRLKEWLCRFHGVATKNLPNYLGWRRTLEALGQNVTSTAMILGQSEWDHINKQRYKSHLYYGTNILKTQASARSGRPCPARASEPKRGVRNQNSPISASAPGAKCTTSASAVTTPAARRPRANRATRRSRHGERRREPPCGP